MKTLFIQCKVQIHNSYLHNMYKYMNLEMTRIYTHYKLKLTLSLVVRNQLGTAHAPHSQDITKTIESQPLLFPYT